MLLPTNFDPSIAIEGAINHYTFFGDQTPIIPDIIKIIFSVDARFTLGDVMSIKRVNRDWYQLAFNDRELNIMPFVKFALFKAKESAEQHPIYGFTAKRKQSITFFKIAHLESTYDIGEAEKSADFIRYDRVRNDCFWELSLLQAQSNLLDAVRLANRAGFREDLFQILAIMFAKQGMIDIATHVANQMNYIYKQKDTLRIIGSDELIQSNEADSIVEYKPSDTVTIIKEHLVAKEVNEPIKLDETTRPLTKANEYLRYATELLNSAK